MKQVSVIICFIANDAKSLGSDTYPIKAKRPGNNRLNKVSLVIDVQILSSRR